MIAAAVTTCRVSGLIATLKILELADRSMSARHVLFPCTNVMHIAARYAATLGANAIAFPNKNPISTNAMT
ncbi:hypothetical protein BC008_06070 [Mastigocoleus testarum BC008]|uniref:Uncharacterized protein n=1 Tax=Mastigocoleus testarum BC008 TaxID=371196 RepID=A0A0V8A073_9CYAN|nr:hypothetical protein BC008_06070 [Mastigocoleus testarum BC008]